MEFPEPVIEIAVEPNSKADQEKLGMALPSSLAEGRPVVPRFHGPGIAARPFFAGMGELHLDIKVDILKPDLHGRREYRPAAGGLS
ncbi:hypothetical protein [Methylobacterium sp.]|uniref:hypothetical protein n=1 Tax=Methylobacterium sp. TaxID=409 RepID=UPI003B011195